MSMNYGSQPDPWSWGVDENTSDGQQNSDWNNGWFQQDSHKSNQQQVLPRGHEQDQMGHMAPPPTHDVASNQPVHNFPPRQQTWSQNTGYHQGTENFQKSTPSSYFYEKSNNNNVSEVENREIAPPDNHSNGLYGVYQPIPVRPVGPPPGAAKHPSASHPRSTLPQNSFSNTSFFSPPVASSPQIQDFAPAGQMNSLPPPRQIVDQYFPPHPNNVPDASSFFNDQGHGHYNSKTGSLFLQNEGDVNSGIVRGGSSQGDSQKLADPGLRDASSFFNDQGSKGNAVFLQDNDDKVNPCLAFTNAPPRAQEIPIPPEPVLESAVSQEPLDGPENREQLDRDEELSQQVHALSIQPEADQLCALDRKQYMETSQLSGLEDIQPSTTQELNDEEVPPPGLHRLVTGENTKDEIVITSPPERGTESSGNEQDPPNQEVARESGSCESDRLVAGGREGEEDNRGDRGEVPGGTEPLRGRVVVGQTKAGGSMAPPPPENVSAPRDQRERDRLGDSSDGMERMVVGEGRGGQSSRPKSRDTPPKEYKDYPRGSRKNRRHLHRDSSYDDEDPDHSGDDHSQGSYRRKDRHRRRDDRDRHRRRREHSSSPEYRSNEEYEEDRRRYDRRRDRDRRPRDRDYSPEYYRDYYREPRRHRRYERDMEDDDYYYKENRSRPSSRTGSDYRRTNLDYSMRPPQRQPFYGRDFGNYSSLQEFCEAFRRSDPVGYAAWYKRYLVSMSIQQSATYSDDRASVHSGQSSSNQRRNVHTPNDTIDSGLRASQANLLDDMTPHLFAAPHIKGKLDCRGRLIIVEPNHYSTNGQPPVVTICPSITSSSNPDMAQFLECPGPFIPGVTHRNTVLQYIKKISNRASGSEKLLYDLVQLVLKSNGVVNGSDIAELLMDSYNSSKANDPEPYDMVQQPVMSQAEIIRHYRNLLQQGSKTEALEYAMEQGLWGHALFLASKMGERAHTNVMIRFANSLPHNDPLQTLYQLVSGHIPQASSYCADQKWSDWRPHLAMMLSNSADNPHLTQKAIVTLGDSLGSCGKINAAHFCYVAAKMEFSDYQPHEKFELLGVQASQQFSRFASCKSIMLTLCYEYGLKLHQPNFSIPSLQFYKLILATRLLDYGKGTIALQFCELLAQEAAQTGNLNPTIIADVVELASRLKILDPSLSMSNDPSMDPEWLSNLRQVYEATQSSVIEDDFKWMAETGQYSQDIPHNSTFQTNEPQSLPFQPYHDLQSYRTVGGDLNQPHSLPPMSSEVSQEPTYLNHQHDGIAHNIIPEMESSPQVNETELEPQPIQTPQLPLMSSQAPTISLSSSNNFYQNFDSQPAQPLAQSPKVENEPTGVQPSQVKASQETSHNNIKEESNSKKGSEKGSAKSGEDQSQQGGWFKGVWDKFSLRPKNQMRLPDDTNPSIVWDPEKKRWVNKDGVEGDEAVFKPPPKATELGGVPSSAPNVSHAPNAPNVPVGMPTSGASVNKYKLQKGKSMKSNYVNVLGGSTIKTAPVTAQDGLPTMGSQAQPANLFVPAPVDPSQHAPTNYIPSNPAVNPMSHDSKQLSRSSSVSSLSREVQYYMDKSIGSRGKGASGVVQHSSMNPGAAPPMYNPNNFNISH